MGDQAHGTAWGALDHLSCHPGCVHGQCVNRDEMANPLSTAWFQSLSSAVGHRRIELSAEPAMYCKCDPRWSGRACDVRWDHIWGWKSSVIWWTSLVAFTILAMFALTVLMRQCLRGRNLVYASRNRRGRMPCITPPQGCVVMLFVCCLIRMFIYADETADPLVFRLTTGISYVALYASWLLLYFTMQNLLKLRSANADAGRRWPYVVLLTLFALAYGVLAVLLAVGGEERAEAWLRVAYQMLAVIIYLAYGIGAALTAGKLYGLLNVLWPTFNSLNGPMPLEVTLRTFAIVQTGSSILTGTLAVWTLICITLGWSMFSSEDGMVMFCIWQTAEAIVIFMNLFAFHRIPMSSSKDPYAPSSRSGGSKSKKKKAKPVHTETKIPTDDPTSLEGFDASNAPVSATDPDIEGCENGIVVSVSSTHHVIDFEPSASVSESSS